MITKYKKNENRNRSSLVFSIILGVLFLAVIGFLVGSNLKISKKRAELNLRLEELRAEYQTLLEKKEKLQAQISQLGSKDALEKEARERFNLKKPGEEVVTILPSEEEEEKSENKQKINWWNPFSW